ncbi:MAG: T9SS type A sorting domain-containing protein [Bacteroidota bacterium]
MLKLNTIFILILSASRLLSQSFTEDTTSSFDGVRDSAVAFADVDGDGDQDALITGVTNSTRISKLYTNDGVGHFTEVAETPFGGVFSGAVAFTDIDGDNDQDLLLTGGAETQGAIAKLYINDPISTSSEELPNTEFTLYPNPTNGQIVNILFDATLTGLVSVQVYSASGRLLLEHEQIIAIGKQSKALDISSLPQGIHLLQLDDGVRQIVEELVVH